MQGERGIVKFDNEAIIGNECLIKRFGEYIDIIWNIKSGEMHISPSKNEQYSYSIN